MSDTATLIAPRLQRLAVALPPCVHVWSVSLAAPSAPPSAEPVLSAEERARSETLRIEALRRRYIWCRHALRHLLGERLGCPPAAVDLQRATNGRPFVVGSDFDFNLTHSGDLALIAMREGAGRIGVDVEAVIPRTDTGRVAERVFTAEECAEWRAAGEPALDAFYRRWTCKEAYLKALGTGLGVDPRRVVMTIDSAGRPRLVQGPVMQGSTMASFTPQPGFVAAAALLSDH